MIFSYRKLASITGSLLHHFKWSRVMIVTIQKATWWRLTKDIEFYLNKLNFGWVLNMSILRNHTTYSKFMLMKGWNHVQFRVEFVFAFPPDYKHHQEQIPLEFVEMVRKCPIHTVKVNNYCYLHAELECSKVDWSYRLLTSYGRNDTLIYLMVLYFWYKAVNWNSKCSIFFNFYSS